MPLQESECSIKVGMIGVGNQWSGRAAHCEEPHVEQTGKWRSGIGGMELTGAKEVVDVMRINLVLKTLKRAMFIIKFSAASVFMSKPMTVMARIIISVLLK
jgi:hypothetical protein